MRVKLQLTATIISLAGIAAGVACKKLVPEYWTDWLLASIFLFWIMEMVVSFILAGYEADINKPTLRGKQFMRTYLIAKGVKLLVTIIYIITVLTFIGNTESAHAAVFAISAVVLYMLHLAGETFVVTRSKK